MKIRNLQEYIQQVTGAKQIESLGVKNPLLTHLAGEVDSRDRLEQFIGTRTQFATNASSQVFYELLQNADDAGATEVLFYFSETYFLVINNGRVLYTDQNEEHKGQLIKFLGRGDKYGDPTTKGRYGQGGKLIYSLLTDQKQEGIGKTLEEGLIHALLKENKGPILFSWSRLDHFEQLMRWQQGTTIELVDYYTLDAPILAKIMCSYYPAMPLEKGRGSTGDNLVDLFTETELEDFVEVLRALSFPNPHMNQGTLLYVPLGEGQYKRLQERWETELPSGVATSLGFLKNISLVRVNEKNIEHSRFEVIPVSDHLPGESNVEFMLGIPVEHKEQRIKLCNLFQYFPIADSEYGLNFVINSGAYESDSGRQRVDLTIEANALRLEKIGRQIEDYLRKLGEDQKIGEWLSLVKALIPDNGVTRPEKIEKWFVTNIKEALQGCLPSADGRAVSYLEIKIKDTDLDIDPSDLGFTDWSWLHPGLNGCLDELVEFLSIGRYSVYDLMCKTLHHELLKQWIEGLNSTQQKLLFQELSTLDLGYEEVIKWPFVRFDNRQSHSLEEILEDDSLLFLPPDLAPLADLMRHQELRCAQQEFLPIEWIKNADFVHDFHSARYLQRFIDPIQNAATTRDQKWKVFNTLSKLEYAHDILCNQLVIFTNQAGTPKPLSELLRDANHLAPSGLLDRFSLRASEYRECLEVYLLQKGDIWSKLLDTWDEGCAELLSNDFTRVVAEMNVLFDMADQTQHWPQDKPLIPAFDEGYRLLSANEWFYHAALHGYSQAEYEKLNTVVVEATNLRLATAEYLDAILTIRFAELPSGGLEQIYNRWTPDKILVSKDELKLLYECRKPNESFFHYFIVRPTDDTYIHGLYLRDKSQSQYLSDDRLLNEFLSGQEGYWLLPNGLDFLHNDQGLKREDDNFAYDMIAKFGDEPALVDLVLRRSQVVQRCYFESIKKIQLSSGPTPENYVGTFEGKVINQISHFGWEADFKEKIRIDDLPLSEFTHRNAVTFENDEHSLRIVFSLSEIYPPEKGLSKQFRLVRDKFSLDTKVGNLFAEVVAFPKDELAKYLLKEPLQNADQVAFLFTYWKKIGQKDLTDSEAAHLAATGISSTDILDAVYRYRLTFFGEYARYFPANWFNPYHYIYLPNEIDNLALKDEQLEEWLIVWLQAENKFDDKLDFLYKSGLQGTDSTVVQFRRRLRTGYRYPGADEELLAKDEYWVEQTFKWVQQKAAFADLGLEKVKLIDRLLNEYYRNNQERPRFGWYFTATGQAVKLQFQELQPESIYLTELSDDQSIALAKWLNNKEKKVLSLMGGGYSDPYIKKVSEYGIIAAHISRKVEKGARDNVSEWDNEAYQQWKGTEDGQNHVIYLSADEIPFDYYLEWKDQEPILLDHLHQGTEELVEVNQAYHIYLQCPVENQRNTFEVVRLLIKNKQKLFDRRETAVIELLGLLFQQESRSGESRGSAEVAEPDAPSYGNNKDLLLNNFSTKHDLNTLKRLENIDEEQLELIANNLARILEALSGGMKEVRPNKLVGLIGERLVVVMLQKKHANAVIDYVANSVPEYDIDFTQNGRNVKIDVKATIKSVREEGETLPFYIKKSQYSYIRKNPEQPYFIIRLSLKDLGLEGIYKELKLKDINQIQLDDYKEIDTLLLRQIDNHTTFQEEYERLRFVMGMSMREQDIALL